MVDDGRMEKETGSEGETGESCAVEGSPRVEHSFAEFLLRARQFYLSLRGLEAVTRSGRQAVNTGCRWGYPGMVRPALAQARMCGSKDLNPTPSVSRALLFFMSRDYLLEDKGWGRRC